MEKKRRGEIFFLLSHKITTFERSKRKKTMRLEKLSLLNFKNIAECELLPSEGINCIVGSNGAGKTNVVDAIHYLSMSKSSLPMTDGQSIRHSEPFFSPAASNNWSAPRRKEANGTPRPTTLFSGAPTHDI